MELLSLYTRVKETRFVNQLVFARLVNRVLFDLEGEIDEKYMYYGDPHHTDGNLRNIYLYDEYKEALFLGIMVRLAPACERDETRQLYELRKENAKKRVIRKLSIPNYIRRQVW